MTRTRMRMMITTEKIPTRTMRRGKDSGKNVFLLMILRIIFSTKTKGIPFLSRTIFPSADPNLFVILHPYCPKSDLPDFFITSVL